MKTLIFLIVILLNSSVVSGQDTIKRKHSHKSLDPDSAAILMEKSILKMHNDIQMVKLSGNADHDLIRFLKIFYSTAIDIAQYEADAGDNLEVQRLARNLVKSHTRAKAQLDSLASRIALIKTYDPENIKAGLGKEIRLSILKRDEPISAQSSVDQMYAKWMIKHLNKEISVEKLVGLYAKNKSFQSIASRMVNSKTKDIRNLERWLRIHTEIHDDH